MGVAILAMEDKGTIMRSFLLVENAMNRKQLNARQLGRKIGISPSFFSQWKYGVSFPKYETMEAVAVELDMELSILRTAVKRDKLEQQQENVARLLAKTGGYSIKDGRVYYGEGHDQASGAAFIRVPVLGTAPAGESFEVTARTREQAEDHLTLPRGYVPDHVFAVRVIGDSMTGQLEDGDTAFVDSELSPQDGDIVVALLRGEVTIKTFERINGTVILRGTAPSQSTVLTEDDHDTFRVLGVVIKSLRTHRRG